MRSFLFVASFFLGPVLAVTSVERYFPNLARYQFHKIEEISQLEGREKLGPFEVSVVKEYALISYSHWKVRAPQVARPLGIEVFEMLDPGGAFGMFSLHAGSVRRFDLPVENSYEENTLRFWRGNYFFQISGASAQHLRELAGKCIEAIPLVNLHPVTVVHLPQQNLIRESVRFYLGKASFVPNNPNFPKLLIEQLGFKDRIEITCARYAPSGHSLFLIGYPTPTLAADYFVKLQNALQGYLSRQGIYMKRIGALISIFLGPEPEAQKVLAQVNYTPTIKWIYEKQPDEKDLKVRRGEVITFLGLVRNTFVATSFFIILTLIGGVIAGIIRYQIVKRYPEMGRKDEMIRLKIADQ